MDNLGYTIGIVIEAVGSASGSPVNGLTGIPSGRQMCGNRFGQRVCPTHEFIIGSIVSIPTKAEHIYRRTPISANLRERVSKIADRIAPHLIAAQSLASKGCPLAGEPHGQRRVMDHVAEKSFCSGKTQAAVRMSNRVYERAETIHTAKRWVGCCGKGRSLLLVCAAKKHRLNSHPGLVIPMRCYPIQKLDTSCWFAGPRQSLDHGISIHVVINLMRIARVAGLGHGRAQ